MANKLDVEARMTIKTLVERGHTNRAIARLLGVHENAVRYHRDWLATAILDRLLHHSHVFNIKGRSYRLRDLDSALAAAR